jgi:DNA repair protein RadC
MRKPSFGGLSFFNLVRLKPLKVPKAWANIMNLFTSQFAEIKISYSAKFKASEMKKISSSRDAYEIFLNIFDHNLDYKECFFILLLNRANKVLGYNKVSEGGLSGTVADPKIIFQTALKANACALILGHNHPSGNIAPSDADIKLTRKLKNAGEFLDLPVLDHLIISSENYYSFADEGTL